MLKEMQIRDILNEGLKSKDIRIIIATVERTISILNEWIEQEEKIINEEYKEFLRKEVKNE
ncbi:MAG: hypothetical protein QXN68_02840 [Thermoplasmata archaeon]